MSHMLIISLKLGGYGIIKKLYNISNSQEPDYGIALIKPLTGCYELNVVNKQLCLRDQTRVTTDQQEQEIMANTLRHSIQVSCSY